MRKFSYPDQLDEMNDYISSLPYSRSVRDGDTITVEEIELAAPIESDESRLRSALKTLGMSDEQIDALANGGG